MVNKELTLQDVINQVNAHTDIAIEELVLMTGQQFLDVRSDISNVNSRLDKVELRLDHVENRLDGIESELSGVQTEIHGVRSRLNNIENHLGINSYQFTKG